MKKTFINSLLVLSIVLVSCSNDDMAEDPIIDPVVEVIVPEKYIFERNGSSTVSFSGQSQRIAMASELSSAMLDFENSTEVQLLNMYANENAPFSEVSLNESGKSIKSKVAASEDYFATNTVLSNEIKTALQASLSAQVNEVFPNRESVAEPGKAGQITGTGSTKVRYVNGKGLEYNQVFAKSLIGALMIDQAINNYLSDDVLDAGDNEDNNDKEVVENGKNYTTMEHKWDEAYGYVYGASQDPTNPTPTLGDDAFLNKYLGSVNSDEDFAGVADDVFNAFKLGRAAIVARDYDLRDDQAEIIQEKLSLIPAVRAVHYLMAGKASIEVDNFGGAFHEISEGYGFIYSLQFTQNPETDMPYFSHNEVEGFISKIMAGENGLWDVDPKVLGDISVQIATKFGFNVSQVTN